MADEWSADALFGVSAQQPRIGAEMEWLVWERDTKDIAQLRGSLGSWLSKAASEFGWKALQSSKGALKFAAATGGTITLEPGGQIEYSSRPHTSTHALTGDLRAVAADLRMSAAREGLELHAVGIDPLHTLAQTPLQLTSDRYARMDAYFAATSPAGSGQRMMRQTAAVQVSVDVIRDAPQTWDVLNRAAPVLTALFANSRMYGGEDSGWASYRAAAWSELDETRTGAFPTSHETPAAAYTTFARRARTIADAPQYRPFEQIPNATSADWQQHLSTLFPDVRPKRHFLEVRCIDAIPEQYIGAPVLLVAALSWNERVQKSALKLLPPASRGASVCAAKHGMHDAELAMLASQLVELTIASCKTDEGDVEAAAAKNALTDWLQHATRGSSDVASLASGSTPL